MKKSLICFLPLAVYCFSSCSSGDTEKKQRLISQIDSLQKKMVNPQSLELDKNLAQQGMAAYEDFANKYPDDTLSPEYLFRVSDLARGVGDNTKAMESLKQICKKYPNYKKIPECLFLQGYYYQEFFNDTVSAKGFYQELISKYPNHAFADDAKALMGMFGKSEADIIKGFEQKENSQAKK
ncbi:MAG: tetratricopeptide repeat protein [Bacteroidetes bacterium]|nr:tetratricopeptide repeat protein [Bacteroidota bacterium]